MSATHTTVTRVRCLKLGREALGLVQPNTPKQAVTGDTQESTENDLPTQNGKLS